MRDYAREVEERVAFIRSVMADAHANALVFANSGRKGLCVGWIPVQNGV